jgi:Carboxypeptidase regulatory-like domain
MIVRLRPFMLLLLLLAAVFDRSHAQQTLGGITGTVTDASGAVLAGATVTAVGNQTQMTRTQLTNDGGSYLFVDLPIGTYTLMFTHEGFQRQSVPSIAVQANRTMTVNAALRVGGEETTITVNEVPLLNAFDTTNGYVVDRQQFEAVPLPTGSFTGVAILSPGVNAELPSGSGVNQGLGNQPIWANGQRDTSNTFLVNGVDASNLFNGKSTSSVASARIVNNTGVAGAGSTTAEVIQTTASPYLAVGEALPTPAPEMVEEFRVNTSMYDAQQGSTSGAHIDMSTGSGSNNVHGSAYLHRGTDWLNAAPYFYKEDLNIPPSEDVPQLHRYTAGGTLGGPIMKNKLFAFVGYQHIHTSDTEIGTSRIAVPFGLGDIRSPAALAAVANNNFGSSVNPVVGTGQNDISPVAFALLNYKLPNGQYLFPSANPSFTPSLNFPENAFITQPAYFFSDQVVSDLDYLVRAKDTLSLKYYYQHDPTTAPFGYSSVEGFTQHLDAGSQVSSITNTQSITPHFSIAEVFGFVREKIYSTIQQPFTPQSLGINAFGSTTFPGITIVDDLGNYSPANTNEVFNAGLNIGSTAASQGAFTGVFQNRWMPSTDASWTVGRHTLTFGGSFAYTQLNTRDDRTDKGMIGFADFSQFLQGLVTPYTTDGFVTTSFLQGNANRYYRSPDTGLYLQDKFQIRSNLSFSAGLRFDDHGGLSEKNGRIYNFDPGLYKYDFASDTIVSNGLILAGNNPDFPTKGVSNSTLTGREWGLAPRLGLAWSPKMFNDKVVVRSGWGMYYDRGELFAYLSPGFAAGVIPAGPFGVNQSPPWVNSQVCTSIASFYQGFIPICDPSSPTGGSFSDPWGAQLGAAPSGNPAQLVLPNLGAVANGSPLFAFADYNRANKLPYSMNQILDVQWQPRNDLAIEIGYVGNLGRHEVIPIPFNQAGVATPTHPIHGQNYTYGYTVLAPPGCNPTSDPAACAYTPTCSPANTAGCATLGLPDGTTMFSTYTGGNVDFRTPYVGYSSESESYTAAGISAYNALQAHLEKRMSHGLQLGFSYTYSHSTDEQSAMGLFYNGNNPLNLRSGYGLSDFDRTHVINFTYLYQFPKFFAASSLKGKIADGWAISGLTVIQSGQPYSVIDYSGAVGSIFYSTNDGITNPVVPLTSCSAQQAMTGASGTVAGQPALNASCFGLPLLSPGDLNGAIAPGDTYETDFVDHGQRNIFRQPWQRRADVSLVKTTQITERSSLKYSFDVFNITNTASFDIPIDDVSQNLAFNGFPLYGTTLYSPPTASGLGITNRTIGSPRQIQMSLTLSF